MSFLGDEQQGNYSDSDTYDKFRSSSTRFEPPARIPVAPRIPNRPMIFSRHSLVTRCSVWMVLIVFSNAWNFCDPETGCIDGPGVPSWMGKWELEPGMTLNPGGEDFLGVGSGGGGGGLIKAPSSLTLLRVRTVNSGLASRFLFLDPEALPLVAD